MGVKIFKITIGRLLFYFWFKTCISCCFSVGFQNLMFKSSKLVTFSFFLYWVSNFYVKLRIFDIFFKLPYVRVFLKNHAKCIGMGWGIREVTASINFRSIPTMSLRGAVLTLTGERRRREFDMTDERSPKVTFNFLHIFWV